MTPSKISLPSAPAAIGHWLNIALPPEFITMAGIRSKDERKRPRLEAVFFPDRALKDYREDDGTIIRAPFQVCGQNYEIVFSPDENRLRVRRVPQLKMELFTDRKKRIERIAQEAMVQIRANNVVENYAQSFAIVDAAIEHDYLTFSATKRSLLGPNIRNYEKSWKFRKGDDYCGLKEYAEIMENELNLRENVEAVDRFHDAIAEDDKRYFEALRKEQEMEQAIMADHHANNPKWGMF